MLSIFNHCSFSQAPACAHSREGTLQNISKTCTRSWYSHFSWPPTMQSMGLFIFFLCNLLISQQTQLWCKLFLLPVLWHYRRCTPVSTSSSFSLRSIKTSRSSFWRKALVLKDTAPSSSSLPAVVDSVLVVGLPFMCTESSKVFVSSRDRWCGSAQACVKWWREWEDSPFRFFTGMSWRVRLTGALVTPWIKDLLCIRRAI